MKKAIWILLLTFCTLNLFSQKKIEDYLEGRKFKNAESGVVMEYGYIPSLNTKGISATNQHGEVYFICSKKNISSDGTYMVLKGCIDQQNESVSGTMYFYRTKVIVKDSDSDRRLKFDLVDENKNITTNKKKTTTPSSREIKVGDKYNGGTVVELYSDGSGAKIFYGAYSGSYNQASRTVQELESTKPSITFYIADDRDLQKLFQTGLAGPDAGQGSWGNVWFMGEQRMKSYSKPISCSADIIKNLDEDSNSRIAKLARYGDVEDRWNSKCYFAIMGISSLRK